jgi:Flp pilus assembly protein TadD
VLATVEDYEAAFEELQRVQQLVPREPPVYALLGEVCQQLGRTQDAVRYFNIALDLEPKDNGGVKVRTKTGEKESASQKIMPGTASSVADESLVRQANLEQIDEPEMPQAEVDVL